MNSGDDETLKAYIDESLEHLSSLEGDLLEMERAGPNLDMKTVNRVFRAAHSIKGGAGFIGLENIKALSHHMESILGLIRNHKLIPNPENINFLLLASDMLKELLIRVEESDQMDISGHIEALSSLLDLDEPIAQKTGSQPQEEPDSLSFSNGHSELALPPADPEQFKKMIQEGKSVYLINMPVDGHAGDLSETVATLLGEAQAYGTLLGHQLNSGQTPETLTMLFASVLGLEELANLFELDPNRVFEVSEDGRVMVSQSPFQTEAAGIETEVPSTRSQTADSQGETESAFPSLSPKPTVTESESRSEREPMRTHGAVAESTLRVHVGLLDSLMTLAGELVLARNQLLQSLSSRNMGMSEWVGKRIDHITSELQEAIMRTRMQPIGNVFNKFPRVARDLSKKLHKEVALTIEGKSVELDKTLIEAIGDPLTHLVRNAIDHGIEPPEQREKAGKPPVGHIRLKAFHEAGQVNIEIEDDGQGLDGRTLADKAVEKGFITAEQAARLSQREQIQLVFQPGFSLARVITDVSGRGVGMDVVKTNLDRLGGQIDISSEKGVGTNIRIRVPLTLAIIPSQIIFTENERYAIPQVNLVELIRVPAGQVRERLEIVGEAEVIRLRSRLLPLVRLSDILGLARTFQDPHTEKAKSDRRDRIADRRSRKCTLFGSHIESGPDRKGTLPQTEPAVDPVSKMRSGKERRYRAASGLNIAVVSSGETTYGLVVDALLDSEEIVVHPLGRHLKQTKGYAGATIMGDGRVALILDVTELAQLADLLPVHKSPRAKELADEKASALENRRETQSLLIFRNAREERFAVPLSQVLRIKKILRGDVEVVSGKKVMQYRRGNLLLFSIDQVADVHPMEEEGNLLVVVFTVAGREIGLLAQGPVDAVTVSETMDGKSLKQPGIMGSVVIDGHTTLLVDVYEIIAILNPHWLHKKTEPPSAPKTHGRILMAEDSNFFRDQVKGFIEKEGYHVMEANDGLEAWQLLEDHGPDISLVVTDLEMPNLDGFGLAKRIKSDERYRHLPVIALTTLAEDDDIERGRRAGIDDYQIKLDRERLMESINRFMGNG